MPKRSHPAHRSRLATGVVGATGFVIMVGTISEGSTETLELSRAVFDPDPAGVGMGSGLDLTGSATPGAAADQTTTSFLDPVRDPGVEVAQQVTTAEAGATTAPTTQPPATEASTAETQATAATTAEAGATTAGEAATTVGEEATTAAPATEAPATAAPTTAAPTTAAPTTATPTTGAPTTTTTAPPDTVSEGS